MTTPRPEACTRVIPILAEFALGVANGAEHDAVVEHIEGCAPCRVEVEELSAVGDALLSVPRPLEPPVGFEVGLFDRMGIDPELERRRRRTRQRGIIGVAAVVIALALSLGGWVASRDWGANTTSRVAQAGVAATAQLTKDGHDRGSVTTYSGMPAWVSMTVRDAGASQDVVCTVVLADGSHVVVGTFWLRDGAGTWRAPLTVPVSEIRSASIATTSGTVVASARLSH